jgi:pantoate--beta-alanine ligase
VKVEKDCRSVLRLSERYRAASLSVGLVPTMGALHAGHLSLIACARGECDRVVVSIFVNPTQFSPGEDLASYPRPLEADLEACRRSGVDLVFCGAAADLYPEGFQTWVNLEDLTKPLCGEHRPGHFRGVATVVTQLLSVVKPQRAYFGKKDYQQCLVVERLVRDLHIDTEVRLVETVREPDGLAMSSRNAFLGAKERQAAARLYRALMAARDAIEGGEDSVEKLVACMRRELVPGDDLHLDYAEARDAETLAAFADGRLPRRGNHVLLAVAARLGGVRLIDNIVVKV